jgi:hypothetical protein
MPCLVLSGLLFKPLTAKPNYPSLPVAPLPRAFSPHSRTIRKPSYFIINNTMLIVTPPKKLPAGKSLGGLAGRVRESISVGVRRNCRRGLAGLLEKVCQKTRIPLGGDARHQGIDDIPFCPLQVAAGLHLVDKMINVNDKK